MSKVAELGSACRCCRLGSQRGCNVSHRTAARERLFPAGLPAMLTDLDKFLSVQVGESLEVE